MRSKYAPLKLAILTTPHFIAVPLVICLTAILNVSTHDIFILTILGSVLGFYLLFAAYIGSTRRFKLIIPLLIISIPLAFALQFIIQIALEYDNVMVIIWAFVSGIIVACTFEILRMIRFREQYVGTIE